MTSLIDDLVDIEATRDRILAWQKECRWMFQLSEILLAQHEYEKTSSSKQQAPPVSNGTHEMMEGRQTLNIAEVGVLLGIGKNQVYNAVHDGQIPTIKVGRKRMVIPTSWVREQLYGNKESK